MHTWLKQLQSTFIFTDCSVSHFGSFSAALYSSTTSLITSYLSKSILSIKCAKYTRTHSKNQGPNEAYLHHALHIIRPAGGSKRQDMSTRLTRTTSAQPDSQHVRVTVLRLQEHLHISYTHAHLQCISCRPLLVLMQVFVQRRCQIVINNLYLSVFLLLLLTEPESV